MILHIYHVALAVFKDSPESMGKNRRPPDLKLWPEKPNEADISFTPLDNELMDVRQRTVAKSLLRLFENIDLSNLHESPIAGLNRAWMAQELGIKAEELDGLLHKLDQMRLLDSLTIRYDYRKWLQHGKTKGSLVIMVSVEDSDYDRESIANEASKTIEEAYSDLFLRKGEPIDRGAIRIRKLLVVPNAHLSTKIGTNHEKNLEIIRSIVALLKETGFDAELNSYGYSKDITLAIIGHPQEYVLRSI